MTYANSQRPIANSPIIANSLLLFLLFGLLQPLLAQVPAPPPPKVGATLEILNQSVSGTDFYFDVYLSTTPGSPGNLYLGTGDFVLTFNSGNFSGPVLSLEPGFCTFVPTNTANTATCRALYEANISTDISGTSLIINLNTVTATNTTTLNNNIANITTATATHRLGRFKVSGISNPNGIANLQWKTTTPDVFTDIYYYATNFNTYPADLTTIMPASAPLPLELLSFSALPLENRHSLVQWIAAELRNVREFTMERSQNLVDWETVDRIPAQNNTKNYAYEDRDVYGPESASPLFYYRLRIEDNGGKTTYSPMAKVVFKGPDAQIKIFPNPAQRLINLIFGQATENDVQVTLHDVSGRLILQQQLQPSEQSQLDLGEALSPGDYMLRILSEDGRLLQTMVLVIGE